MPGVLLVIDMLNPYDHEDAEPLKRSVAEMLPSMRELIAEAAANDILTVYVNDNHGDWSVARRELTERALRGAGRALVEPIAPPEGAPFVVKARHSDFYENQLEYLLRQAEVTRILLTGQVTEPCIL